MGSLKTCRLPLDEALRKSSSAWAAFAPRMAWVLEARTDRTPGFGELKSTCCIAWLDERGDVVIVRVTAVDRDGSAIGVDPSVVTNLVGLLAFRLVPCDCRGGSGLVTDSSDVGRASCLNRRSNDGCVSG